MAPLAAVGCVWSASVEGGAVAGLKLRLVSSRNAAACGGSLREREWNHADGHKQ